MKKTDYYKVLGITKKATPDEIKKAWKSLAVQYHPDKHEGSRQAALKFVEAAEAYEALSDPKRRVLYDRYGHAGLADNGFTGFDNMGDVYSTISNRFEEFFDSFAGSHSDPSEVDVCENCGGTGSPNGTPPVKCEKCKGQGKVQVKKGFFTVTAQCPECKGDGRLIKEFCPQCNGLGRVSALSVKREG